MSRAHHYLLKTTRTFDPVYVVILIFLKNCSSEPRIGSTRGLLGRYRCLKLSFAILYGVLLLSGLSFLVNSYGKDRISHLRRALSLIFLTRCVCEGYFWHTSDPLPQILLLHQRISYRFFVLIIFFLYLPKQHSIRVLYITGDFFPSTLPEHVGALPAAVYLLF